MTNENELTFIVDGMSCSHCEIAVKQRVGRVDGVEAVDVDLITKRVVVRGRDLSDADLSAAVDEAGYDAVRA
jgi:copper chaperone